MEGDFKTLQQEEDQASKVLVQQNSKWQNERKNLDTELAKLAKAKKALAANAKVRAARRRQRRRRRRSDAAVSGREGGEWSFLCGLLPRLVLSPLALAVATLLLSSPSSYNLPR
jgi:hypothetical protein